MRVHDFTRTCTVQNEAELASVLRQRTENGDNAFWISQDEDDYPMLGVLVKGDLAYLYYIPEETDPGFCSSGNLLGLKPEEPTSFLMSRRGQDIDVLNESVVPISLALEAAKEFISRIEIPKSVKWMRVGMR